jgi:hypothetical protein
MTTEEILIEAVAKLQLSPGDTIIIKAAQDSHYPAEDWDTVFQDLYALYPNNKIILLEHGIDISILSKRHRPICRTDPAWKYGQWECECGFVTAQLYTMITHLTLYNPVA